MSDIVAGWTMFWDGGRVSTYDSGSRQPGAPVVVGEAVTVDGPIAACKRGLHGSEWLLDALDYSPCWRPTIGRCRFEGEIAHGGDKLAASSRTVEWLLNDVQSEAVLRLHARWSALTVLHLWDAPDVVVRYLVTGDDSLRAAAWAAARVAARDAAWAAARAAARAAAGDASNAELERLAWAAHRGEPLVLATPETARAIVERVMGGAPEGIIG